MSDSPTAQSGLLIVRHAVQALLHRVLNAAPQRICGLMGGRNNIVEVVYPCNQNHPVSGCIENAMQSWKSEGMSPLAIYASSASPDDTTDILHGEALRNIAGTDAAAIARLRQLPLLLVRLDIKGRLEAILYAISPAGKIELPLVLQEDGRSIPPVV